MTVFKAFLKIVSKNKFVLILYSVILILFGGIMIQTSSNSLTDFTASKPVIAIVNNDKNEGVTGSLIKYLSENGEVIETKNEEEILDGLFYGATHYAIFIPENYSDDFQIGRAHV